MVDVHFIQYDDERHRAQYIEMLREYTEWLDNEVNNHYGVKLIQDSEINQLIQRFVPIWTSVKPPRGDIYILEANNKAVGMGRLSTLEEGIGEVHNIWTSPEHRGKGYATRLMKHIEEKAREFGFSKLRLDTARFNHPAQRLYHKIGYREIDMYKPGSFHNESLKRYYEEKVYMEKKL